MVDLKVQIRGAPWAIFKRLLKIEKDYRAGRCKKQILEILVEGSAGGGKSFGCDALLWWLAERYPGTRWLVMRTVKADLATSFQKVWEEDLIPPGHPMLATKRDRRSRDHYEIGNGSVIVLGGMDDFMRHRGSDYDGVLFEELVEYPNEDDWAELRRALRNWGGAAAKTGRSPVIPFQLMIGLTNPDAPDNWVNQRFPEAGVEREFTGKDGELLGYMFRLLSQHKDNPKFWVIDRSRPDGGYWTEEGAAYMANLDALTGVRRARLRDGLWVAAEGVVYENFRRKEHVIPRDQRKFKWYAAGMDWGYNDPSCLLVGGVDDGGRLVVVAEIYRQGMSISWWCERVKELHDQYQFVTITASPDRPEVQQAFNETLGMTDVPIARPANNKRASDGVGDMGGIDLVRAYLERRRLFFFEDRMLYGPDPELVAKSKPTSSTSEFGGYVYRSAPRSGTALVNRMKELTDPTVPDHGMDALRYLVTFVNGRDFSTLEGVKPEHDPYDLELARAMGRKLT